MSWINFEEEKIDNRRINIFSNGKTIWMKGTNINPFFVVLDGEYALMCDLHPTHFFPLPDLPLEDE